MSKTIYFIIAAVAIIANIAMYVIGNDSSHLSELKDFWYVPSPLAIGALIGAFRNKS